MRLKLYSKNEFYFNDYNADCNEFQALNYNPDATYDDGTCYTSVDLIFDPTDKSILSRFSDLLCLSEFSSFCLELQPIIYLR